MEISLKSDQNTRDSRKPFWKYQWKSLPNRITTVGTRESRFGNISGNLSQIGSQQSGLAKAVLEISVEISLKSDQNIRDSRKPFWKYRYFDSSQVIKKISKSQLFLDKTSDRFWSRSPPSIPPFLTPLEPKLNPPCLDITYSKPAFRHRF